MMINECSLCGCRYEGTLEVCDECWDEQTANSLAIVNEDGSVSYDELA